MRTLHPFRSQNSIRQAVMLSVRAFALPLALMSGLWFGAVESARAEGALAIGNCGAYGYAFNYDTEAGARDRAMSECTGNRGKKCKVVVTLSGNCAAFAIDNRRSCGAWGWASRATKEAATEAAVEECRKGGGKSCGMRAQVCDAKPAPAMTTNWVTVTAPQAECVARAEMLMKEAGLTKNYEVVGQSVFGEQGDFTAQIRCITDKTIALFVVVGPELEGARKYMAAIFDKF
ncbi:MAG: hypothetical protein JWN71_3518 [Xanthobacteraceae bacterium]|jgi:hypothetical protein|nr:hypothetical protein [Xanthobacteraceae bacterium]